MSLLNSDDYMGRSTKTWQSEAARPIPNAPLRVMEWAPGRFVTDLKDVSACLEAHAAISDAILSIEGQIEAHEYEVRAGKRDKREDWLRRVNAALRAKRRTLAEVRFRAEHLRDEELALLAFIKKKAPSFFSDIRIVAQSEGIIQ